VAKQLALSVRLPLLSREMLRATAAPTPEDHFDRVDGHAKTLCPRERQSVHPFGLDVEDETTALTNQMVMIGPDLGVVSRGAVGKMHFGNLTHRDELVQRVVHRRQTDLWHHPTGCGMHLLRAEVHVLALEGPKD
jgi:hypothetical protein